MIKIDIGISQVELNEIERRLGNMTNKMPITIKRAVNETAQKTRSKIASSTKKRYATKITVGEYKAEMKVKTAATASLQAEITAQSEHSANLLDFKVNPNTYLTGEDKPEYFQGKVLKASGMKNLEREGFKAFIAKFSFSRSDGTKGETLRMVSRVPEGKVPGRSKLGKRFIKSIPSPSRAQMFATVARTEEVQEHMNSTLRICIDKHIKKVLEGK